MPLPWELERALLCERLNWSILPHELDNLDIASFKIPLQALRYYKVLEKAGIDLDSLTDDDLSLLEVVSKLKRLEKQFKG